MDKLNQLNQSKEALPELRNLDIQIPEIFVKGENTQTIPVSFNGKIIELHIFTRDFSEELPSNMFTVLVRVLKEPSGSLKDSVANVYIVFEKNKEGFRATTGVSNSDRTLKGLGRELYDLSLKLIQKFARKHNAPVTHMILKLPDSGLSTEKWDELFLPILEREGYKQVGDKAESMWEKTYLP